MVKSISETIAPGSGLTSLARRLKTPADYYRGRRRTGRGLPDNILLFLRREGQMALSRGGRHFHHRNVLVVPLQGEGRIVVDGRAFALGPGRCGLIAPYQFHYFSGFSAGEIDWLFVTFEGDGHGVTGTIFRPLAGDFWGELERLLGGYLEGAEDDEGRLACRLALMLSDLARERPVRAESRKRSSDGESLLLRVHELVAASMGRMLSVEEMARRLGLSASHLRARFRAGTGKSLGGFQREVRLQKAAEALSRGGATVAEVAEACGWSSPFAFSRAFNRYWGMPPKRFALSVRG